MASAVDGHGDAALVAARAADALGIAGPAAPRSAPAAVLEPRGGDDGEEDRRPDSAVTSPPYWIVSSAAPRRRASRLSVDSDPPAGAITLRDNDTSKRGDADDGCWARGVDVVDYTVVNGSATNIGAFVVWNVRVETLNLTLSFPGSAAAMPVLPPKSIISRFRPAFLEKRRAGLQYFVNCIMLNPEFSGSPVLRAFLFP